MSGMDRREKDFEGKYARDEDLRFKATARRNKLLGLWAAEKMGLSGEAAEAYAAQVVLVDFEEPGSEDVYRKIKGDLDEKSVALSEHQVRRMMEETMHIAMKQIMEDGATDSQ